jgi:hypothetical protein
MPILRPPDSTAQRRSDSVAPEPIAHPEVVRCEHRLRYGEAVSELTPCNFCTLRSIRARADRSGKRVILRACTSSGGLDVHVVLKRIRIPDADRHDDSVGWVAWFKALGTSCEC